jgi:hypothetical protein
MAIKVVLDVFSGLENPVWILEPEQETEFLARWTELQSRSSAEEQTERKPPGLGYRGFELHSTAGLTLPEPLKIYGGTVRQGEQRFDDRGREFETWLLGTATPFVSAELARDIKLELMRP